MAQQDDYYYEIQLTNKQLVFYFMAGATGLILSFLAGVMVGRGVDAATGEVQAARPLHEDRVVTEEPVRPVPAAEDLTYPQRLESDKAPEGLEKPPAPGKAVPPAKSAGAAKPPKEGPPAAAPLQPTRAAALPPAAAAAPPKGGRTPAVADATAPRIPPDTSKPAAAPPRPAPAPVEKAPAPPVPASGTSAAAARPAVTTEPADSRSFSIQVGAFKDRSSADQMVARLKGKGYAAFVANPGATDGLFNVRVGSYSARTDAEKVQAQLRDQEKAKPFIVRN